MRKLTCFLTALIVSCFFISTGVVAKEFKIGVLAKNGAAKAVSKWGGLGQYLSDKVKGDTFTIVPLGFDEVDSAIENGTVDYFLINSSMFTTSMVKHGTSAVATMINSRQGKPLKRFGGVVFARADRDDISVLNDLKGKSFMAVKNSSFGGWQMALKEFHDTGLNPEKDFSSLKFGGKHDSVVHAVKKGSVDAGTVRTDTLERMAASGKISMSDFKIIKPERHEYFPFVISTPLYPEWPLAKTKATSKADAKNVRRALIRMEANNPAAIQAKIVGWTSPLDYNDIAELQRTLEIGAYEK